MSKEDISCYEIKPIDTEKHKVPLKKCMKDGVIAKFPSSCCFSGRSGSGKSCLLMNMLTNPKLLKNYFHYICVYSPTAGKYDDTYSVLDLPEENFIPDFGKKELEDLIQKRKELIDEKGISWVAKNARVCIILDDIVSNRSFLESQTALKLFCLLRHYLCSIFILVQSYTKLPRALRLNCNSTYIFPCNQSEVEVLLDEVTPAGMSKKDFLKVISYCTDGDYDFMAINNHAKRGQKIRKNLTEIIDLERFKTKNKNSVYYNKKKDNEQEYS